jgi:hypothetical protein
MAGALLTLTFYRSGQDLIASGFLVFAVGEGLILSGAAMDLAASVPSFGAGTSLWALALVLISIPSVFPLPVRLLGFFAVALFGVTALRIFAGTQIMPTTAPLPFDAYPVLVATLAGWTWTLVTATLCRARRNDEVQEPGESDSGGLWLPANDAFHLTRDSRPGARPQVNAGVRQRPGGAVL